MNDPTSRERITWVSVTRYCELYDVNRKTVYKYLEAGLLQSWQVGRVLRVEHRPPHAALARRPMTTSTELRNPKSI